MLLVKTYTAPDAFGGTGLFLSETIKAGTLIWGYHPSVDVFYSYAAYRALPQAQRDAFGKYFYPAIRHGIAGVMYSRDNDRFTNHSLTPNTGENGCGEVWALRDIAAGEEITADYFGFVPQGLPDFWDALPGYAFLRGDSAKWRAAG